MEPATRRRLAWNDARLMSTSEASQGQQRLDRDWNWEPTEEQGVVDEAWQ